MTHSGILVFGRTGQVACELARRRPDMIFLGRDAADLADPAACAAALRAHAPAAVINAAAWTAVDKAESDEAAAHAVNAAAPAAMAGAARDLGIPFVHISTDYVFDGSGEAPWAEDAPTGPLGAYGRTKLAGEAGIVAAGGTHAILRTAWVFSAQGANFVKTMLRLAATRDTLSVVEDQVGGPTWAGDIAAACLSVAEALIRDPGKTGIYHYAGVPQVSWAGFAREIFARSGRPVTVTGIPSSAYPTPAARPKNSRLDCRRIGQVFGLPAPDWRTGLDHVLKELEGSHAA